MNLFAILLLFLALLKLELLVDLQIRAVIRLESSWMAVRIRVKLFP